MNILEINLILIFFFTLIFLKIKQSKISKMLFLICITAQLTLINGLRSANIGVDTNRYKRHFYNINNIDSISDFFEYDMEIGYKSIQKIIGMFTDDFQIFLLTIAFFMFFLLAKFIFENSKNYFLSYFLFVGLGFFEFSLSGIRQTLAMIIGLFTINYAINKDYKKFIVILAVATSFHYSALILIPLYFLANLNIKNIHLVFLSVLYLIIFIMKDQIGVFLTILYYSDTSMLSNYQSSGTIGSLSFLILFIIGMGFYFHNPFVEATNTKYKTLLNVMIISFFIQSLSSFSYLFTRLNMYYLMFIIIYLPNVFQPTKISLIKMNYKSLWLVKRILKLVFILLLLIIYLNGVATNANQLLPYSFFWE